MKYIYTLILLTSINTFSQATYSVNCTTYYVGQYYSTGHPKVKRSEVNKKEFLESLGLKKCPVGYEVDHMIPLHQGGTDECENMQLLTVNEHRKKTIDERKERIKN